MNELIIRPKDKSVDKCVIYMVLLCIYWLFVDVFNQYIILDNFTLYSYLNKESVLFNIIWIGIFTLILYILKPVIRKWVGIILNTVILIFTIINYFMNSYFGYIFSWKDLILTGEGISFVDSVFKYINIKIILFTIICIIINIIIAKLSKFKLYKFKSFQTIVICVVFIILIGLYLYNVKIRLSNISDGWNTVDVLSNKSNYYTNWIEPNKLINICGTYQYMMKDLYMSFFQAQDYSGAEKTIEEYLSQNKKEPNIDTRQYNGIYEGKNIIFVMMESMDNWLISEEVTPTIWYMMQHGFNFNNHYSPAYVTGYTANTEFIANTGLYPNIGYMSPNYAYTYNAYPYSIANLFRAQGYTASSFHRSYGHVYNRENMHMSLGYEKYYPAGILGVKDENIDLDTHLIIEGYNKMVSNNKYMSFIITYTPHSPYTYSDPKCTKNLEEIKKLEISSNINEELICALSSAKETDNMFKILLKNLYSDGKLEDTVIVAFADHPNNLLLQEGETQTLNKTSFFIYSSEMGNNQIETITSSINILPTIINLFGIDTDFVYPGYDALNTDEEYVVFKDYTYYDGQKLQPLTDKLVKDVNYCKSLLILDYYKTK